jgi:hypothetical protein
MDGPLWKMGIGVGQDKTSFSDIVRAYLVGNIDEETPGVHIQNHALHRRHVMVFCAKIGEKSDNRVLH